MKGKSCYAAAVLLWIGGEITAQTDAARLNVVYILADDMGYGDVSAYNPDSKIPTPVLDSLAASGIRFTDAHSNSSVSTPTRYGTLTGRYTFRSRLKKSVLTGYSAPLIEEGRETVASFLKKNGYQTACIGKWHLGLNWTKKDRTKPLYTGSEWDVDDTSNVDYEAPITGGPTDCGFDYSCILPASLDMSPYLYIENGKATAPVTRYAEDYADKTVRGLHYRHGDMAADFHHEKCLSYFTEKAENYIRKASKGDKPYFLYFALTAPHSPWMVDEAFRGRSNAGTYGDFVCMVDETVRRICETVEQTGTADRTLIIFTSDNGAMWQKEDIAETGHCANGGWSGKKSDLWEGGHRVPLIVSCPQAVRSGVTSDALVCATDLFATMAEMIQQKVPAGAAEDSFSYWKVLAGQADKDVSRKSVVYHSDKGYFALRKGDWVLLDCKGSGGWTLPEEEVKEQREVQLYNLKKDPAQRQDVAQMYPERVKEMKEELEEVRNQ